MRYAFLLSGIFGEGGIELSAVLEQLKLAAGKPLSIQLSSIGGDVETGVGVRNALMNYVEEHGVDIEFDLLGWAQSTGSYITTIPGATVKAHPNTLYMLHNPSGGAWGDYRVLQARLSWLEPVTADFRESHMGKSGKTLAEVTAEMDAETFYLGQEIVDAGYADELVGGSALSAIGGRDELIATAKKEQSRLRIAAMGGNNTHMPVPIVVPAEEDSTMGAPNTDTAAADAAQATAVADATAVENARATAYGDALQKLPAEMHKSICEAFAKGESASYFNGAVNTFNMTVDAAAKEKEAADHAAAQASGTVLPGQVATPGDGQPAPVVAVAQAAGETGERVKV